jgi:hypothetical protein
VSGLESKFGILYGGLPSKQKRHLGPEETSEKWRLLAEKQRLESKLKSVCAAGRGYRQINGGL